MGLDGLDVDLASSVDIASVAERLEGSKFKVKLKNLKLGAILIECEEQKFEYTAFREEEYCKGGKHSPCHVARTDDLMIDAKRRDFSVNSIYCNVKTKEIVDPYGGVVDISKRIIRTGENADKVMGSDGERILRMVRFAGELGFGIEKETFKSAKKFVKNICDIQGERRFKEFERILNCDKKYGIGNLKFALLMLKKLGVFKDVFGLKSTVKFKQIFKSEKRFYGFLIDVVDCQKPKCLEVFLEEFLKENFSFVERKIDLIFEEISSFYKSKRKTRV